VGRWGPLRIREDARLWRLCARELVVGYVPWVRAWNDGPIYYSDKSGYSTVHPTWFYPLRGVSVWSFQFPSWCSSAKHGWPWGGERVRNHDCVHGSSLTVVSAGGGGGKTINSLDGVPPKEDSEGEGCIAHSSISSASIIRILLLLSTQLFPHRWRTRSPSLVPLSPAITNSLLRFAVAANYERDMATWYHNQSTK